MDNKYELTPDEIKFMDTNIADQKAIDSSLKIAVNYHANQTSMLTERADKLWDNIRAKMGFTKEEKENYNITLRVKNINGQTTCFVHECIPIKEISVED